MPTMMEVIDKEIDRKEERAVHAKVMRELQKEWETNRWHQEQRYTERGIRSSQLSTLIMHLIRKGVLK
ncbi:hypothetical protein KAR91_65445 [Candidatus Pacearchaeota archaeon]|nr:hypothetical protein [Candidatus Pacearchaeota archaeon]